MRRDRLAFAALLVIAVGAAGCSGSHFGASTTAAPSAAAPAPAATVANTTTAAPPPATAQPAGAAPPPQASPSLKDKITNFFSNKSATTPQAVANADPDADCPYIDIRQGASTLTIPPPPPEGGNEAMTLKYQGDFVRAARDCKVVGNQMVMRIGIQGRIIVGPAGGPGEIEIPLRIAVVSALTTGSKTIATKLIRFPVTVRSVETDTTFTHVEEGFAFPMPSAAELASYIVYIGFDPIGAAAEDQQKARATAPAKPKPKTKPNPAVPTG